MEAKNRKLTYQLHVSETVSLPSQSLAFAPATGSQLSNTRTWMSTIAEDEVQQTTPSAFNNLDLSKKIVKVSEKATKESEDNGEKSEREYAEFKKRRLVARVKETGFDSMKHYMKTMGNHELLQKNEEIILAREIQKLISWESERESLEVELLR